MRFDGSEAETCRRCGFDSRNWTRQDAVAVFELLGYWWRLASAGLSIHDLNRRPAPRVWSALEYGLHSAMAISILRYAMGAILAQDGIDVHDPCPEIDIEDASSPLTLDAGSIVEDLEREGAALAELVEHHGEGWEHMGRMDDGTWWQAEATLLHAVHDTTHHFFDVGEGLARVGAALPASEVTVRSVNISAGGVAKVPVESISVSTGGVEGDPGAGRRPHGGPFQAVCLWSTESIADLAAQGHAVEAGTTGEDLTLTGLEWARLRPGTRLSAGTALLELSYPARPDHGQAPWLSDGGVSRRVIQSTPSGPGGTPGSGDQVGFDPAIGRSPPPCNSGL